MNTIDKVLNSNLQTFVHTATDFFQELIAKIKSIVSTCFECFSNAFNTQSLKNLPEGKAVVASTATPPSAETAFNSALNITSEKNLGNEQGQPASTRTPSPIATSPSIQPETEEATGRHYQKIGNHKQAAPHFLKAANHLNEGRQQAECFLLAGMSYVYAEENEQAAKCFKSAWQQAPEIFDLNQLKGAGECFEKVAKKMESSSHEQQASEYFLLAMNCYIELQKFPKALLLSLKITTEQLQEKIDRCYLEAARNATFYYQINNQWNEAGGWNESLAKFHMDRAQYEKAGIHLRTAGQCYLNAKDHQKAAEVSVAAAQTYLLRTSPGFVGQPKEVQAAVCYEQAETAYKLLNNEQLAASCAAEAKKNRRIVNKPLLNHF
ncbi:MAG: hypothetical protein Q8L98_01765 [Chlamydiales bacterium]|nr:hypothetical protein [Chlamydiales bacterium]